MTWKSLVPVRWRLLRSRLLHAARRSDAHFEEKERRDFFRRAFRALAFNGIEGDYAEFGCCGGMTFGLAHAASRRSGRARKFWAFDSFAGLPQPASAKDAHPQWTPGEMAISLRDFHAICRANHISPDDYEIIEGYYERTLADASPERADRPRSIALAYVDCDLYSSTQDVLRFLVPRLRHGMIIAFDDYFCWSADEAAGERRAMLELCAARPDLVLDPFLQFGWHGMSFVVQNAASLATDAAAVARLRDAAAP
ncbi:hypothetical protein GW813_09385 [bacterium]|nr:hypothetical protein [bacterium]PIP97268.1 MAG: hypothetical protein COW75_07205 [Rhodobacterales bacterium CG18_big_fil_WC_8_21_14_2_50_71_9]PIY75143.1 MAG: hypothetical protein COY86_00585 [Rhodobacterales bacterium CG_4_10_14_0_8_um_filter_70_9]PJA59446.1 MAG: hypothetical protein CO163_09330 [Rhodobacterales bacterium CG_4_9_14_3_um_filter_71_31]